MVSSPRRSYTCTSSSNTASDSELVAALAAALKAVLGEGVMRETATELAPVCESAGNILDVGQAGGGANCGTFGSTTAASVLVSGAGSAVGALVWATDGA